MAMRLWLHLALAAAAAGWVVRQDNTCTLFPESLKNGGQPVDDAPSIEEAFELCGHDGKVVFAANHVFNVNSVMNTTNLVNCDVSLRGELRFSTDIPYWLSHSYSVVFQDQSTAWLFGGTNVTLKGEEGGWYNGQGQAWYTQNRNQSNQPGRPISITFYNSTNLWVDGLKIIQPQFWATFVWQSRNVSITNFYVNATSNDEWGTVNTDGYDSWNSHDLLVENAVVSNQDDCIAVKGNTTNLLVRNVVCHRGFGMAIGSLGQYPKTPDYVENITFEDVKCINCMEAAFIKTWQGIPEDDSSNGDAGGGGSGLVKNVVFRNFELTNVAMPIQIAQCIYNENAGNCNTSKMAIEDVTWSNIKGTSRYNIAASLYCSDVHPCPGIKFDNIDIQSVNHTLGLPMSNTNLQDEVFQCQNLVNPSGVPCNRIAPSNYGQVVTSNVRDNTESREKLREPIVVPIKNGQEPLLDE
ncbi:putative rhamnogalacturonan alpha-L-rhamnopyranohydrolase [Penicillium oxalicum 114-2]|uniref:galacturonan 1,4-alpha-galacturonidase n=1 Tax=Penicillium oxalicum (strain 114-2 / CGMCC 5302) TaxID=933388 RepID=S7ZZQ8_PENO1|nr:putative rhamnogalacturonan alpha-L-rhamnopyranohydrolase [Penicillium oxalicum 114-2]